MRDPNRIEIILDGLKEIWKKSPDQRFLQLIFNLQRSHELGRPIKEEVNGFATGLVIYDGFNVEDDIVLQVLEKEINGVHEK